MIRILILTVLAIYVPYVENTIGSPCKGDSDCVMTSEACNPLSLCQCKAGYSNYTADCYKGSGLGGPCQNRSECVADNLMCNTSAGSGTCVCIPTQYEYQGSCTEKGRYNATCYTADGCMNQLNLVCNNSSGGICVCPTGYFYYTSYGKCIEKLPVGYRCYIPDSCRDEHASCTPNDNGLSDCRCIDGYYEHQGSCILRSGLGRPCQNRSECVADNLMCNTSAGSGTCVCIPTQYEYQGSCTEKGRYNDTCYTADGCMNQLNLVCNNSSGGICVCPTGYFYYTSYGKCIEKLPVGSRCYIPDSCRDEHARCTPNDNGLSNCRCIDRYYEHQGSCISRSVLGENCQNIDGCIGDNVVCDNVTSLGVCMCDAGYYVHQGLCYEKASLGGICQNHDSCTGDGVVCSSLYNGTCVCNSTHIRYQEHCYNMPDAPENLSVLNVTSRAFTIMLIKPIEVFGELLGYVMKLTVAETGRCVKEYLIRCTSGCVALFPNQTSLSIACPTITQYLSVSKQDLIMMKPNVNTLDPDTVYWISVAAVNQYGKGYTADLNVTTLHEGDLNVSGHSEPNSMTTIIIASSACGALIVIALTAAGTVIIIKRKRASNCSSDTVVDSTYMDLTCKAAENRYDTLNVTSPY